jgi:protein MAK16
MKTVERAHSPKNLWEKISLSRNYTKALAQIDEHLAYFPKALIHRNKQRLTKVHQYLIRMRKIELKVRSGRKAKMVGIHRKIDQREERRERKALVAAKIERNIEKELVERLAKGTYGDIYNFPEAPYQKALQKAEDGEEEEESESEMESEDEEEGAVEYVEDLDSEEEEEEDMEVDMEDTEYRGDGQWGNKEEHDDDDSSAEDDDEDSSSDDDSKAKKKPAKKVKKAKPRGPRIEIEYEEEREDTNAQVAAKTAW